MLKESKVTFLFLLCMCARSGPAVTCVRIVAVEDDYEEEMTSDPSLGSAMPGVNPARPCAYDPCKVQSTPCEIVSARTGCLCPGLMGPHRPPDKPELRELIEDQPGVVLVHWCAPRSIVRSYKVSRVGSEDLQFGSGERSGVVPGLTIGETVCVVALNEAGVSEEACTKYVPAQSKRRVMTFGITAGGVGLMLLLSALLFLLWRRRQEHRRGKREAQVLGNPSNKETGSDVTPQEVDMTSA